MNSGGRATIHNTTATLLRDLIHEHTGIFFADSQTDLMLDKLSDLVAERSGESLLDYYYRLKYDADVTAWSEVLDAISVRETYFWREFDQIRALTDSVLPKLAGRPGETIRIWSAACASGEEPLTIAMALDLAGWFDRVSIEIHASDVSEAALRSARNGIYRERSFRSFPMEHRERFFTPVENGWKVKPCLHQRIQWRRANLTRAADVEPLARAQVVFCRNVFIYFSDEIVLRTARFFEKHISRPGYLFLGAAESLLRFDTGFELEDIDGAFAYVKK
jgi:chemotaxis protein methyltransferase CheR